MTAVRPSGRRMIIVGAAAAVLLAAGSTLAMAAAAGAFDRGSPRPAAGSTCLPLALPGIGVDVRLTDMGAMMRGPGWTGMRGGMRVLLTPTAVSAGQVSLRVTNTGSMVHELVVLPLAPGGTVGTRPVSADGTVSEDGSLGEASKTCGAGQGNGITPGASGWVTLTLAPGRYELVCNLPGHYQAGMYATLTVS